MILSSEMEAMRATGIMTPQSSSRNFVNVIGCIEMHSFNIFSKHCRKIREWGINKCLNIERKHWSGCTIFVNTWLLVHFTSFSGIKSPLSYYSAAGEINPVLLKGSAYWCTSPILVFGNQMNLSAGGKWSRCLLRTDLCECACVQGGLRAESPPQNCVR